MTMQVRKSFGVFFRVTLLVHTRSEKDIDGLDLMGELGFHQPFKAWGHSHISFAWS